MSEQTLTHKDLAGRLGLSETTVKSYRRKFPGCIPVANKGKPIRFTPEALDVATRIRDLFETGMSVEEVRARLGTEFSFISPEEPLARQEKSKDKGKAGADRADIAPELSTGVSNMAKSMVSMAQQQKAILTRMQHLENMLEDLGLAGTASDDGQAALGKASQAARKREEQLEERLNRLDQNTLDLAGTVQGLALQLERFIGRRSQAAEEWRGNSAGALAEAAQTAARMLVEEGRKNQDGEPSQQPSPHESAKVIPLRRENQTRTPPLPDQPAAYTEPVAAEPHRGFYALPLVARSEQGKYISAGGRSRGRFSINDLKALLVYGFAPPNHFTLRWERHGQGWWLFLEQETEKRSIHLLLMELPTQKGGSVAEVLQIVSNGDNLHPAEFSVLIDSFGA